MKQTVFVASSRDDLIAFPEAVRREVGFAIQLAQEGSRAINSTPLVGFGGAGVCEVISNHDGDTFRCVYTVRFEGVLYVLHAFKKKSVRGIKTPQKELNLVRERLKQAEEHHARHHEKSARKKNGRQKI